MLNSRILYDNASMWLSEIDFTVSTNKHLGCFQEYFEPHLISFHLTVSMSCILLYYDCIHELSKNIKEGIVSLRSSQFKNGSQIAKDWLFYNRML